MPTPNDTTLPPSPRSDTSSRSTFFATCPPEERETSESEEESINGADDEDEHAIPQQPTPEPEECQESRALEADVESPLQTEHIEDISTLPEGPISPALPETKPGVASTHRSLQVEYEPSLERRRNRPTAASSFLRPGSRFHGTQRSDRQVYDVQVEIKDVNMDESFLCGYLRIQGLTDDHPTLTTFFEGEIIGPKHLFKTTNTSWGSTEKVDLQHWARFPAWRPLAKSAKSPNFTLKNFQQREHLFMRWKEYFLVPDHRVKTITGASFEGFYYICFNQCDGQVSGIYFHAKSEKYQQLELQHVEDHGCMAAMEFR
ncbi:hypothetical protein AMS68_007922 [Peltaster fructicola]|uniref:Vesicle-mediated transport protein Vid24 n=1 Tax=Peltaster fructicola TaxID=286661 RepID=A0A6H0Y678_9PEZI|nr:hypothetical protein AMS68_007922 [Peltaster fructicola]